MKKLIPVVLLVGLMSVGACDDNVRSKISPPEPAGGMFTSLTEGEQIEADYTTTGCFNHTHHRFLFHINDVVLVAITEIEETWSSQEGGWVEGTHNFLGTLELSGEDLRRLDNLVRHYQQLPEEHTCTTVDGVTFRLTRESELVEESSYTDGTCATPEYDVLPLGMLVLRINDPWRDILE